MRVAISHKKGKQEAMRLVQDQSDQLLAGMANGPVQIMDAQKTWTGSTMNFAFKGKMGFFTVPIEGKVDVTETEVIIEADLPGFVTKMIPEEKIKASLETRVKGLLT